MYCVEAVLSHRRELIAAARLMKVTVLSADNTVIFLKREGHFPASGSDGLFMRCVKRFVAGRAAMVGLAITIPLGIGYYIALF